MLLLMSGGRAVIVLHMQRAFSQKAALSFSIVAIEKTPSMVPDSAWSMQVDTNSRSKYHRHGGVSCRVLFFFLIPSSLQKPIPDDRAAFFSFLVLMRHDSHDDLERERE